MLPLSMAIAPNRMPNGAEERTMTKPFFNPFLIWPLVVIGSLKLMSLPMRARAMLRLCT